MKKIVIIGANDFQNQLILKAKEMGLPVTLATDMSREKRKEILRELEELMNGKKHHTEEN